MESRLYPSYDMIGAFVKVFTTIVITLLIFCGCSKNKPSEPTNNRSLSLSISTFSANSKGSKSTFTITASGEWSVSGGDGWCIVTPASGTGNATANIDVLENKAISDRSTVITITSGSIKREISVTQSEKSAILLTGRTSSIDCNGGKIAVEVKSNVSFDITIPLDAAWITYLSTKTLNTNTLEFNIDPNSLFTARSAKVILKEKNGTIADTLTVNQEEFYFVHTTVNKIYLQKDESSMYFYVQSSVETDFTILEGSAWISLVTKDEATKKHTFKFTRNPSESNRFGKIAFFRKGGGSIRDTVDIKQSGFDGYYIYLQTGMHLDNSISAGSRPLIYNLKIEGALYEYDFIYLRSFFRHLDVLDLSEATLQDNIIPDVAFAGDNTLHMALKKIVLPAKVTSIGYAAFSNCSNLETIQLPEGLINIGKAAFTVCTSLSGNLTLPSTLETIDMQAFSQCEGLDGVILPKSLKSIGFGAFHSCNLLTVTALMENPFPLGNSFNSDGRKILIVPKGKKDVYSALSGWNNTNIFKKIVETGDSFEDFIRCDKKSIIGYNENNTASFKIESSSEWKVDSKPSWVSLSKSSGNGGETINVTMSSLSGMNYREGKISLSLLTGAAIAEITVYQHSFSFTDGSYVKLQSASMGAGVDLVFMGDGYSAADIAAGKYVNNINTAVSHFFDIEPYRSYREYFNIYMVYGFSQESGISDLDKKVNTLFNTKFKEKTGTLMTTDELLCKIYALKAPVRNINSTTVILIANSPRYAGTCSMCADGFSVAICPVLQGEYPYDFRGVIQHEACGHGFGQLADEYTNYTGTIPESEVTNLRTVQGYNMYLNVDATNDHSAVLWKHFFSDPLYSYVSTFEGGYYYTLGIWRPESGSVMINNIRYMNAPSREIIVKRIKRIAGETFTFTEFRQKDRNEMTPATKAASFVIDPAKFLAPPIIVK